MIRLRYILLGLLFCVDFGAAGEVLGGDWPMWRHDAGRTAETPEKNSSLIGTTAVFYPPDAWAINDRLLLLDLPRDSFDKPGKLYIWFLRGDRILWQEELMWPGQSVK